VNLDK